jgi:hypothetical protein
VAGSRRDAWPPDFDLEDLTFERRMRRHCSVSHCRNRDLHHRVAPHACCTYAPDYALCRSICMPRSRYRRAGRSAPRTSQASLRLPHRSLF